jgi:hypothetical protein
MFQLNGFTEMGHLAQSDIDCIKQHSIHPNQEINLKQRTFSLLPHKSKAIPVTGRGGL